MNRVTIFFRRHRIALILAVLFGILHGIHHPLIEQALQREGKNYYPMLVNVDDRYHTAAKIKEVYLTGKPKADLSLWEYRDVPAFLPALPHYLMAALSHLTGSIKRAYILAEFLFPPLTFFLLYLLMIEASGKSLFSLFFASFSTILPRYLAFFPLLTSYYQSWFIIQPFQLQLRLPLNRLDDPLLTVPFFLLLLYFVLRTLLRKEQITAYLAGISFGILFYVYFYYYVYASAALGIAGILALIAGRLEDAKRIFTIIGIGIVISIPYWFTFQAATRLPGYRDLSLRIGPEHGFAPFLYPTAIFAYLQHTILAIAGFFLFWRRRPELAIILAGFLLAVFVIYNFQIITGFNPQPDHWIKPRQVILTFVFFLFAATLFARYKHGIRPSWILGLGILAGITFITKTILTADPLLRIATLAFGTGSLLMTAGFLATRVYPSFTLWRFGRILGWTGITLLFLKGIIIQASVVREYPPLATLPAAEERALEWLIKETPPHSVIGTPSFVSNTLIKHVTKNRIFVPDGFDTVAPSAEILLRFFMISDLFAISPETFSHYFATPVAYPPKDEDHEGLSYLFTDQYRAREPGAIFTPDSNKPPLITQKEQEELVNTYRSFRKNPPPIPYRLDYLYYGPREQAVTDDPIKNNPELIRVYEQDGIAIYKTQSP